MSEGKFSKCEEGKKCLSIEFRMFGKKNERGKKKLGEDVWVEFLLSSCSLVRLFMLILQVKVTGKKWKFSKYFSVKYLKLKIFVAEKKGLKLKKMFGS